MHFNVYQKQCILASCKSVDDVIIENTVVYLETRNSIHVAFGINFSSSTDVSIASAVESHLQWETRDLDLVVAHTSHSVTKPIFFVQKLNVDATYLGPKAEEMH